MVRVYSDIKITYYTGTGGTELVAKHFQSRLEEKGCTCVVEKITNGQNDGQSGHDLLILLFPVHAFNAPEAVYQWIDHLNAVKQVAAAVISVSGGGDVTPNTACRLSSIKRLCKKGYQVLYDRMMVMPSNWMAATQEPLPGLLIQALPRITQQITSDLLSGIHKTRKPVWVDRIFSLIGECEKPAGRFWGKHIQVLPSCSACGWCVKHCPAENIVMLKGKPTFGNRCHICLKCIYGCANKALQPGIGKFFVIKEGYCLQELSKNLPQYMQISIKDLKVSFLWIGVKKYLMEFLSPD